MNHHHDGPDGPPALKEQDPAAVEKEEDGETELDGVAHSLDVIHGIVQALPSAFSNSGVVQKEAIDTYCDYNLYHDLNTEG